MSDIGVIGLGVMGRNLAWNMVDHGFEVAVWNREPEMLEAVLTERAQGLVPTSTLAELVAALTPPRRILLMITAGRPVDLVMDALLPLLTPGDIVIDGGNSWFEDTRRREASAREHGIAFVGMGVSGGEDGARFGPSLMPGGSAEAYAHLAPILEAIAAKTDSGPCVTHVGPDGAGHFVKMVHNGIEYADMQLIAEAYDVLKTLGGLSNAELAATFAKWNEGELQSFLIEITAKIFTKKDPDTGKELVEVILDATGMKGTGKWTVQQASELGAPIPTIASSVEARMLSAQKAERVAASKLLPGVTMAPAVDKARLIEDVRHALYASKVCSYAQGMNLLRAASNAYKWGLELGRIARIWKGGCIIRAQFLSRITAAFQRDAGLANLLIDADFARELGERQPGWRRVVSAAVQAGIPLPTMTASISYFDGYRRERLPANLLQAQRDFFGAHTYQRIDKEGTFHTEWES